MEWRNYFNGVLKGTIFSVLLTVILCAILSLAMIFFTIENNILNVIYVVITCLGIIGGAIIASKMVGENGWMVGAMIGGVYYIVLFVLAYLLGGDYSLGLYDLYRLVISLVIGVLSGMIGINLSSE